MRDVPRMGAFFERIAMSSRLSPEDQKRVEQYLSAPQHQVERQPFRPWRLLLIVIALTIGLGLLSRLLVGLAL